MHGLWFAKNEVGNLAGAGVGLGFAENGVIEQFDGAGTKQEHGFDGSKRRDEIVEMYRDHAGGFGEGFKFEFGFDENAEGSFGAAEEAGEVPRRLGGIF